MPPTVDGPGRILPMAQGLGNYLTGAVILGSATVVIAPVLLLVWRRSRRPSACRKAHAALQILLGGALGLGWLGVALAGGGALPDAKACVVVAFALAILGASGLLAIWGLVDVLSSG